MGGENCLVKTSQEVFSLNAVSQIVAHDLLIKSSQLRMHRINSGTQLNQKQKLLVVTADNVWGITL